MLLRAEEQRHEGRLFNSNDDGYTDEVDNGIADEQIGSVAPIPIHPLGIKPLGNLWLSATTNARGSIGTLQALPDEMLALFLEYLDHQTLRKLGYTCRFLFAFCRSDELWKALFLE